MRVLMTPQIDQVSEDNPSGIQAVVKHYYKYLPDYGVELVKKGEEMDVLAIHAGTSTDFIPGKPVVALCHGLYWSADYKAEKWALAANRDVVEVLRRAEEIVVPSAWVATNIRRDMRRTPTVIGHGIEPDQWQVMDSAGYVLWNKNRPTDACSPEAVNELAKRLPAVRFLTTFAAPNPTPNMRVTGSVPHKAMREMVMRAGVYLATTKETFGIGTLEAMASGVPVLGWNYGGTADLVKHGFSGFLAQPGDYDGLAMGYDYCMKYRRILGANARAVAQTYTWDAAAKQVAQVLEKAVRAQGNRKVAVVIPCYNKAATLLRAVASVVHQTHKPDCIIIVNNNSQDAFDQAYEQCVGLAALHEVPLRMVNCERQGVAHARNLGCAVALHEVGAKYVVCLDADDEIMPDFLGVCLTAMLEDSSIGVAYTRLEAVAQNGQARISEWPGEYNFDRFLEGQNQVPTCAMFRLRDWEAVGGYKQKYAPMGAGSEDADFWLRLGAIGAGGKLVTDQALFRYHLGGLVSGNPNYHEVNWRGGKPWVQDRKHPFASLAKPANGLSHLVMQYDEPTVSVVIPCAKHHLPLLETALDSLEAQTFRRWEAIVAVDGATPAACAAEMAHNPYVKFVFTDADGEPKGAGAARNLGASVAKGGLLLFLDADDWLEPTAIAEMVAEYGKHDHAVIYTDYYGHAYIEDKDEWGQLKTRNRIVSRDEKTGLTVMLYETAQYDCERAQRQPEGSKGPYIWNVVTSLVPARYHHDIGGFDETMESWEDWDYWLRMARRGVCFERLAKPLFHYRFHTGTRRFAANPGESGDSGRQLSSKLLNYISKKFREIPKMPCKSCGGKRTAPPPMPDMSPQTLNEGAMTMNADMVIVELMDGNIGDHLISFAGTSYGYRKHGEQFMMQRAHATKDRRVRIVQETIQEVQPFRTTLVPPPPVAPWEPQEPQLAASEPANLTMKADDINAALSLSFPSAVTEDDLKWDADNSILLEPHVYNFLPIWGVNEERQKVILEAGIRSLDGFIALGVQGIEKLFEVQTLTARRILSSAEKLR